MKVARLATFVCSIAVVHSGSDLQSAIIDENSKFGVDISIEVYEDTKNNIWISPFSITSCFALIYPGSAGQTKSQIAEIMGYPLDTNSNDVTQEFLNLQTSIENIYDGSRIGNYDWSPRRTIIGIANKIFSANDLVLKETYTEALSHSGESFIDSNFDFGAGDAVQTINDWVNDNTNGLIEEILSEDAVISDWRLVALNAIYLNGTFQKQFESFLTSKSSFYGSMSRKDVVAECHLMHQIDYFGYYENDNFQFLKFPFNDEDLFALFVLPKNENVNSDKNGLITDWTVIEGTINNLQSTYVALALPKLSIEAGYALKEPLQQMGMTDVFSSSADFSDMSEEKLKIDAVIHKTMVEMDEKGLVAAAVTMIGMVATSVGPAKPTPILFKADHSFQMLIIDGKHENTVLFMGQINDPGIPEGGDGAVFDEATDDIWTPVSPSSGQQGYVSFVNKVLFLTTLVLVVFMI